MAAPVIISEQSVLEYLQWQNFEFQPYATNSPTSWNSSPLPPGLDFDAGTGLISGAATAPGVYDIALTAINEDGASTPLTFTVGIEATSALPPVDSVDLTVDLGTGEVSAGYPATRKITRGAGPEKKEVTPLFWLKYGDSRLLHIRFSKGGVIWSGALESLKLTMKAVEPETVLVTTSTMDRGDTGGNTFYRLAVVVTGTGLKSELSDSNDDGDGIAAIGELEWTWANSLIPVVGPETLRTTTLNFFVGLAPELTPNT